jgi:hypothetical protein
MKVIQKELKISGKKPVTIVPLSDLHIGNIGCDVDKLKSTIKWIKDNDAYTILFGDLIDAITQKDPRHESDSIHPDFYDKLDNLPHEQTLVAEELLMPIKDRIIATMGGNHETAVKKHFSYDSPRVFARAIDAPLMPDPSVVRLRLRRSRTSTFSYDIWCSHGLALGNGRMVGSKVNNIMKIAGGFHADAYMAGHTHNLFTLTDKYMFVNRAGNMESRKRIYINTGSFQKTHDIPEDVDTWASRSGFLPTREVLKCMNKQRVVCVVDQLSLPTCIVQL